MLLKNRDYKEIRVVNEDGVLLASITDEDIIEKDGFHVELVTEEEE